ncbi:CcdB family protein [Lichenicoccus sp.]|uniref:CcdB family protein n=1 Tax=Lichenicoccus sp. TaxID=2781899 RepID=UPI003D0E0D21
MAQFDVFRNPGRQREVIPFVVVLQNARFDRAGTRFVAPLVRSEAARVAEHHLAPRFTIDGAEVILDVFNLATLPADRLGRLVVSLADEESRAKLIRALDAFISQA